jgi:hypothetical protein
MPALRDGDIRISGGEIQINEFYFTTTGYEPPQYARSIAYSDTTVASGSTLYPRRNVTDMGPLLGVWRPFTIHCHNNDTWDAEKQHYRGLLIYQNLLHLFRDFLGVPLTLREPRTGAEYTVMFSQDGLTPSFAGHGDRDTDGNDYGPEYDVQISLIEVVDD